MFTKTSPQQDRDNRALAACYLLLIDIARQRQHKLAQLGKDPTVRTCTRCGGSAYLDGDYWVCWNCGATEPADE